MLSVFSSTCGSESRSNSTYPLLVLLTESRMFICHRLEDIVSKAKRTRDADDNDDEAIGGILDCVATSNFRKASYTCFGLC